MRLESVHPELEAEQAYVDNAYAQTKRMLADVTAMRPRGFDVFEQAALDAWRNARIGALSDTALALVFGRIDRPDETFYIGRHHVMDEHRETIVVDWRADVSRAFYQAGLKDPMGLRRRRHFLAEGRQLLGISDDYLTSDDRLRATDVLEHELSRRRGAQMRDIVGTIQAEQDAIIRAPLEGVVVVQGGPGTGKTVIGLHRAAYLLYEYRQRLQRLGVLIIGPNPIFVKYIEQVLPSLGESATMQLAVHDLPFWVRTSGADSPEVEKLKGDVRMAEVIRRALDGRPKPAFDLDVRFDSERLHLDADHIENLASTLRQRNVPVRAGRELFRDMLVTDLYRNYLDVIDNESDDVSLSFEKAEPELRRDPGVRKLINTVWPLLTPPALISGLFASAAQMKVATQGILTPDEMKSLKRRKADPFTLTDRPLLDEASSLIDGTPVKYGHIVVDEAQDLSPMQVRMIARRCPEASVTVLGDLGQSTGVWAHDHWDEILEHMPAGASTRVEELTMGYRVSAKIMQLAARVLATTAPTLTAPKAVRADEGEVEVVQAGVGERGAVAAQAARELIEHGSVAVIAVRDVLDEVHAALMDSDDAADAMSGLGHAISLVDVQMCKGLEFDAVVLVEPAAVTSPRLLYVSLTRAMRALTVVHSDELPEMLRGALATT